MSKNKIIPAVVLLFMGVSYLYTTFMEPGQIKDDYSITTGKIYELERYEMRNMTNYTKFRFSVDGKEYERESRDMKPCEDNEKDIDEILGFDYPVIYNNEDPNKSRLLISPKQFEAYGISYQESLRPFYEKYWGCK
jgi:hypothetical protein